jgi:hypothetical protein
VGEEERKRKEGESEGSVTGAGRVKVSVSGREGRDLEWENVVESKRRKVRVDMEKCHSNRLE